jgi:hypothetical protein
MEEGLDEQKLKLIKPLTANEGGCRRSPTSR